MNHDLPRVLIAAVSSHERLIVESSLKKIGLPSLAVDDAEDAATEFASNGTSCVLVIDSGLLEAPHDSQWRVLRARHPGLGAVVRCLLPRASGSQRMHGRTFLIDPGDDEGLRQAVRALVALPNRTD